MKFSVLVAALVSLPAFALTVPVHTSEDLVGQSAIESSVAEFDPTAPNAMETLELFDQAVEAQGGSNWIGEKPLPGMEDLIHEIGGCRGQRCPVYAYIDQRTQRMMLRTPQASYGPWATSTGVGGRTPSWAGKPNGRIYEAYSSKDYPGGDYEGLGNMPYAVFLFGPFAIHGTPPGNWRRLGSPASHGCIRIHPNNALTFNRIVRQYGRHNVWVVVN